MVSLIKINYIQGRRIDWLLLVVDDDEKSRNIINCQDLNK